MGGIWGLSATENFAVADRNLPNGIFSDRQTTNGPFCHELEYFSNFQLFGLGKHNSKAGLKLRLCAFHFLPT